MSNEERLSLNMLQKNCTCRCNVTSKTEEETLEGSCDFKVTFENHLTLDPSFEAEKNEDVYWADYTATIYGCPGETVSLQFPVVADDMSEMTFYMNGEKLTAAQEEYSYTLKESDYFIYFTVEDRFGNELILKYNLEVYPDHEWGEWNKSKEYEESWTEYRECSRCGYQEFRTVKIEVEMQKEPDGSWKAYKNGDFVEHFTGIATYDGGEFFVANGIICSEANGLNLFENTWYFLSNGQIQYGHDGFAEYDDHWFIIKDGQLDLSANGLFEYDGGIFLFAAGQLKNEVSGLWQNYGSWGGSIGDWYFLSSGQVQTQYTGVAEYNGQFVSVTDGRIDWFTGLKEYDGERFLFIDGYLRFDWGKTWDEDGTIYELDYGRVVGTYTGAIYDYHHKKFYEVKDGKIGGLYTGTYHDPKYVYLYIIVEGEVVDTLWDD